MFTMMLSVLLVRLTKILKSSLWSSKACGSNNLLQTCPKTPFLFVSQRGCFASACSHWGADQSCTAAWEMRAWVEAQVSSPQPQGLQRTYKIISCGWHLHLTPQNSNWHKTQPMIIYWEIQSVSPQSCHHRPLFLWSECFQEGWLQSKLRH